jgi:propanol-preferring alcohol dehydrogenase
MKAWVFTGVGRELELQDLPDPVAKPGEVAIDVKATGLCHSDVSALDDPDWAPLFPQLPVVLGHEGVGLVSAVGEGVTRFCVGDRVGIPSGPPNLNGYTRDGTYAEKTTALAEAIVKMPDNLDFVRAASATDAGNVAHHAVVTKARIEAGQKFGIIGVGGLGQIGARIAVLMGAEVYAAEPRKDVWPMAESLGVIKCATDIRDLADIGLDVIIDFAGFGTTTTGALESIVDQGRVLQVGMGKLVFEFNAQPLITKQVELLGSMGGGVDDLRGVFDLMATGKLDPLVTAVPFTDIDAGLDQLRRGAVHGRLVADLG